MTHARWGRNARSLGQMIGWRLFRAVSPAARLVVPALALGIALGLPEARAAPECQGSPAIPYDIDLNIETPTARVRHDRGIAELGRMRLHGSRVRVLGLASIELDFGWRVGFEWRPEGDAFCFWVRRTELTVRHLSPEIYVAREYPRDSCSYRAILAHEQRHIRTSNDLINRYVPRLRWVLTSLRIPTGRRPARVDSLEQAKSEVQALMEDLAEPLFDEMAKALRAAQAKLDSPASYARLLRQCRKR